MQVELTSVEYEGDTVHMSFHLRCQQAWPKTAGVTQRTVHGATPIGGGVKWRPDLNGGLFGGAEMAAG